ncbi:hypothetical protein SERLA73DRAFT_180472 [Serpula lacrymans var. lacrymans S7.3]|uniref:Uncharacterized protein n=2 Tax=Serpula lacrymans var. lacrymans TaxID=341189 RepID=F8PUZ1_SERL3|nr:uncharacterized protein SERLADRAFT_466089 [Serpula lacrymans var. lacrymans S7.9]EGO00071.1 hypothetical protein SERLA73DRAFT_180472 [Serpula lacrymans var. lacrymans S7.3]EGO25634.1 hypothetical protein SERLADRAFT_466089 [Serpula lacrymans var. lacrymans S7.9]
MEDFTDLFVVSVLEDEREREERISITRRRMGSRVLPRQASFHSTLLPASVPESVEDLQTPTAENIQLPPPPLAASQLSPSKWAFLKHLSLADNAMTFLSMEPLTCLASLTHLDLSSNLLVSVPHGLSVLHNLVSLNLSDNMIDSVLGIYTQLGQVLTINLSRNRLESLCGLERLMALERVDLRHNYIVESGEVGRLATVPNITEVWVEGNPLAYHEDNYRINCFDIFLKEGKNIQLDGTPPSFSERRTLTVAPDQIPASRSVPAVPSPSVVAVGVHTSTSAPDMPSTPQLSPSASSPASRNASPMLTAVVAGKSRRKRNKRIVDLDGDADHSDASVAHSGLRSHNKPHGDSSVKASSERERPHDPPSQPSQASAETTLPPHSRHRRRNTDHSSASAADDSAPMSAHSGSLRRISRDARALSPVRRSYMSTSIYEPPTSNSATSESKIEEAEAYRARIEALRSDMGDGWLKVFSQSQLGAPTRVGRR